MKKTQIPVQFRQGDVLVTRVPGMPVNASRVAPEGARIILAHGEATGHAHAIAASEHVTMTEVDGARYLDVSRDVFLQHEEHGAIKIPAGSYLITRQREYSPEAIRNVAD